MGWTSAVLWTALDNDAARHVYEADGWEPDGATQVAMHTGEPTPSLRYACLL